MRLEFYKSCSGEIFFDRNDFSIKIRTVDMLDFDVNKIIQDMDIITKYDEKFDELDTETKKELSTADFYYAYIPSVKTYINVEKIQKISQEKIISDKPIRSSSNIDFMCEITESNYELLDKKKSYPGFFKNIMCGTNAEETYLESIGAKRLFFYEDDELYIIINIAKSPISSDDVKFIIDIIDNDILPNIDLLYYILSKLNFMIFLKDPVVNKNNKKNCLASLNKYWFTDIFSLKRKDNEFVDLLEQIKLKIHNFYLNIFFSNRPDLFDINALRIMLNQETIYNFITFDFFLLDIYTSFKYTSFVDYMKYLSINELIDIIKKGDNLVMFQRITTNNKHIDTFCKNNPWYRLYKNNLSDEPESSYSIKQNSIEFIQPLQNKLFPGKYARVVKYNARRDDIFGYCTQYFLIDVENEYYVLNIKSINYEI
jgi:hypothetical protein